MTMGRSATRRPFKTFAWQGITLSVPENWTLAHIRGGFKAGSVRLADESAVRLEVRWESKASAQSVTSVVTGNLSRVQKKAKRDGHAVTVQRDLNLADPPARDSECYRWATNRQVLAMLSRCSECGRSVHLQVMGSLDERLRSISRTVFASLQDHAEGDCLPWRFMDVRFGSPARLPLETSSLKPGCIRMRFGRRLTKLEYVRVSLAEVLLKRDSLEGWFRGFYAKDMKRRSYRVKEHRVKGHDGIQVQGAPWLVFSPLRLVGRGRLLRAYGWHCEETNRIFICLYDGPERSVDWLEGMRDSMECCESGRRDAEI